MEYTPINVTDEKFISTLREVANEHSEHVYESPDEHAGMCYYVHESPAGPVPGCIIGVTLARLGVPLEVLSEHEHEGAGSMVAKVLNVTGDNRDYALWFASSAQDYQDGTDGRRYAWGEAVAKAAERVAGLVAV
jgi:hypothetical protein